MVVRGHLERIIISSRRADITREGEPPSPGGAGRHFRYIPLLHKTEKTYKRVIDDWRLGR